MAWDDQDDKNNKQGPWGSRNKDDKNNEQEEELSRIYHESSSGDKPPDLDDILRQATESFGGFFGNGGGNQKRSSNKKPSGGGISLGLIALVFLIFWGLSGFYRVLPEENAVILTFGKWTETRGEPGLGYRLPYPIQDVMKVNVAFDRRIEIGFREKGTRKAYSRNPENIIKVPSESQMVTGDENIVDIHFVVMWNIVDAKEYLFEIRDPETTIKKVAESAMREIIGRNKIQNALTDGRADIEAKTKDLMQQMLNDYKSGVIVNNVQLLRVDPPEPVVDAFDDVQRARSDKERARNEGETYRNDIVPKARGMAQQLIQGAEAYKEAVISKSKGEAARFLSIYEAYKRDKAITKKRLYIEAMQDVMKNSKKVIVGSESGNTILPYLSLDQLKKK